MAKGKGKPSKMALALRTLAYQASIVERVEHKRSKLGKLGAANEGRKLSPEEVAAWSKAQLK